MFRIQKYTDVFFHCREPATIIIEEANILSFSRLIDQYRPEVEPVLTSKVEEFKLLGYETITADAIWGYLKNKKWKQEKRQKMIHEIVGDILAVKAGEFMNYVTVQAFKQTDMDFDFSNEEDRRELLK